MDLEVIPCEYPPRAAGEAAGASAATQRDMLKRGFIQRVPEGLQPRYDLLTVGQLALLAEFSRRGVGPKSLMDPGERPYSVAHVLGPAANALAWHVMGRPLAWMGGTDALDAIADMLPAPGGAEGARSVAWDRFHLPERQGRFLVWWSGHRVETTDSLDAAFAEDAASFDTLAAPAFVLDLSALADRVRARLPGPAFIIRRPTGEQHKEQVR